MKRNNSPKIIGITGGIGAGKSTVLSYLQEKYEAFIIKLDDIGHELQKPEGLCWNKIVSTFGDTILNKDGSINRSKLSETVYDDEDKMNQLNAIMHPAVKEQVRKIIDNLSEEKLIVLEAALLLEDHYERICDEIWYVYAPMSLRIQRLKDSRGYSEEKSLKIINHQLSDTEFRSRSNQILDNSDSPFDLYNQIDDILKNL